MPNITIRPVEGQEMLDAKDVERIVLLIESLGLPIKPSNAPDNTKIMNAMKLDKKAAGGQMRLVLPTHIGEVTISSSISEETIMTELEAMKE